MRFRPFGLAVALASAATIGLELTLTRIFSVTLYYHFAFMVISVASWGCRWRVSAPDRIGKAYAFDLVGAAVGCAAVIPAVGA